MVLLATNYTEAKDIKSLLNKVASGKSTDDNKNVLETIGSAISNFTANSDFAIEDLCGTWVYVSPAVCFKSDNDLQNIGGAAAATSIENKLAPYYAKAGIDGLTLTVDDENKFTMKLKRGTLTGVLVKTEDGNLEFDFNAFNKINLGKITAHTVKSFDSLSITFDISKLISIVNTISSMSGNSSLKTVSSLLSSYENIYAGFKLKQSDK